jgi:hypothetical protein
MKNNNQNIYFAIFVIFTILIWIGADLYHISLTSTIPENMKRVIAPFNPKLDLAVIESIKEKKNPSEFEISTSTAEIAPSATPTISFIIPPTAVPTSTDSGIIP